MPIFKTEHDRILVIAFPFVIYFFSVETELQAVKNEIVYCGHFWPPRFVLMNNSVRKWMLFNSGPVVRGCSHRDIGKVDFPNAFFQEFHRRGSGAGIEPRVSEQR